MFYQVVLRFDEKNKPEVRITDGLKAEKEKRFQPDRAYYRLVWDDYVGWFEAESEEEAKQKALIAFEEDVAEKRQFWDDRLWEIEAEWSRKR